MVNFYNCIVHIKLWKQKEKKQILFFFFVLLVLLLLLLLLWYCLVQFFFAFVFVLSKIPCCCFAGFACGNLSCENSLFHVFLLLLFCYFHIFFIPLKEEETTENRKEGGDGKQFWRHRRQKERWQWWSMTMALMVSLGVFEVFADSICFKYQQHYRCVSSTPSLSSVFCCFYFSIWLLFLFFSLLSPLSFLFPPWIKEGESV